MKKHVIIFLLPVLLSACIERGPEHQEEVVSYADWNDRLFQMVEANDFANADTLSAWLLSNTRKAGDFTELINAGTNTAISYLQRRQMDNALEMLERNLELIDEYGTPRQHAYALVQLTNVHTTEGRNRDALEAINEAVRLIPEINNPRTEAAVYATKAAVIADSDPARSLQLNYQALDVFLEENDRRNEAISRNNIGLRYHSQENYDSALREFENAININTELDHQTELAINYNNIANTLSYMGNKMDAADSLLKAIEINRRLGVSPRLIQNNYNLAQIYIDIEAYEEAYLYFLQGYEESRSIKFAPGIMYHATGLARAALKLGKYDEVSTYLAESREYAERLENLRIVGSGWEIEASLMEELGDYQKAVTALRNEKMYSDSLDSIQRKREFEEIRTAYEVDLVDAENELLRQELSYQERLTRAQQLVLVLLLAGVLLIVFFLRQFARSRKELQKAYKKLEENHEVISSKNRQLLALNNELSQLNNDKDKLIGIIVHDLRNPLFGVIGFLDVISETVTDGSEKKHLEMARKSAQKLNSMINSLLDVHALEKEAGYQEIEEVIVDDIITNSVDEFRKYAEDKDITIDFESSGLKVETHVPYLTRIIDNLVSNAVKFSSKQTRITIKAEKSDDSHWQLIVSDEGPGISDQDRKKMFQMFGKLTARPTGGENSTGLGLYAVNMLVERLSGSITVHSEMGDGSRFICEFPVHLPGKKSKKREEMHSEAHLA